MTQSLTIQAEAYNRGYHLRTDALPTESDEHYSDQPPLPHDPARWTMSAATMPLGLRLSQSQPGVQPV
jgi:hypothetical protein